MADADKNAARRAKLREELISTEQSYVHGLELLQHIYLTSVELVRKDESGFSALPTDAHALEISLPTLCTLHAALLKEMQDTDSEKLPTVITKYAPMFSCYTDYLSRYETALNVMERLKKKKKFKELMEAVESKISEDSGKRLLDYLITPVQRLPRYVMLLSELLKHTDTEHSFYAELKAGHAKLSEIAMAVNEGKRRMESLQKLTEIQNLLKDMPADFTWPPHRTLLREGKLKVTMESFSEKSQSLKKIADRILYLFSDKLLLTKADHVYVFDVPIASIAVEAITETETDFTVTNSKMSVVFRCDSADERTSWMKELEHTKDAMKDLRGNKREIKNTLKKDTLGKKMVTQQTITAGLTKLASQRSGTEMVQHDEKDDGHEDTEPESPSEPMTEAQRVTKLTEELIATERSYVHGLDLLQLCYITAVDVVRQNESQFSAIPTDAAALEITIPMLHNLHNALLKDLEATPPDKIASVLAKYAPTFSCYTDYLSKYEAALQVMERLKKKKKFKELMDAVDAKLSEGSGKRLLDYLITPVQRLPRYVMLLAELLKHTDETTPLHAELKAGHAKIQEIALAVNEGKRRMEGLQKLTELQAFFKEMPAEFTWPPHRTLLREGKIQVTMETFSDKAQSLKVSDRMLYLFSDKLLLTRSDGTYRCDAMIASISVESITETETDFTVSNSKMSVSFRCVNADERAGWVEELVNTKEAVKDLRGSKRLIKQEVKRDTNTAKGTTSNLIASELKKLSGAGSPSSRASIVGHLEEDHHEDKKDVDPAARRLKLRDEIIGTLQSSVATLSILQTAYLTPMDQVKKEPDKFKAAPIDHAALEFNLPQVIALHQVLLKEAKEADADHFPAVISKHAPEFSCYGDYLDRYEGALGAMDKLSKQKKFKDLLAVVDKALKDEGIEKRLIDYLITPLPKLFTFVKQLTELIKCTQDATQLVELKAGYAKIHDIAQRVNEGKKKMEARTKVLEVQALLKDLPKEFTWPPNRVLVRHGKLKAVMETFSKKAQSLKVSERVLFLFSDKLLITRADYTYRYDVNVSSITIEPISETETDFTISNSTMSACFRCESVEERASWVKDLEETVQAEKQHRGSQRMLVRQKGTGTGTLARITTTTMISEELQKLKSKERGSHSHVGSDELGDDDFDDG